MYENNAFVVFGSLLVLCVLISSVHVHILVPTLSYGSVDTDFAPGSLLFVGDIMLGRHVESLSDLHGDQYVFQKTKHLLNSVDVSVANFEASVPQEHVPTPDNSLTFSVHKRFMSVIKDAGIDMLSLANNHSFDYGEEGYLHTHAVCYSVGIICGGHPYELATISTTSVTIGDTIIGMLFLHGSAVDREDPLFAELMQSLKRETHEQFVFIHWGVEYETVHSDEQQKLAHYLIDEGIDAVIGHHPHVVQDIEFYRGKPIFYSLGNFIFDQYFSDDVQIGLGIKIDIKKDMLLYTLIPLSSLTSASQPSIMDTEERGDYLATLTIEGYDQVFNPNNPVLAIPR